MKFLLVGAALSLGLVFGMIAGQQQANANSATVSASVDDLQGATIDKKCSFDSDCSHGKCRSGKCGGCSFNSDCKGWGICKDNQCGNCNFNSDCKGFGSCSSNKCTKSAARNGNTPLKIRLRDTSFAIS